jgi:hypothetical protein
MLKFSVRMHPDVMFAYSQNSIELLIRVENHGKSQVWCEADIRVPEGISLNPATDLRKGRVRIGILSKKEFIEKSVRIFANAYTAPQIYAACITLYAFNKDGVIATRLEKKSGIRCEIKKTGSI